MTPEHVLAFQSDPVADQILLLMHFYYLDPGYQKQGHENTVIYIL